MPNIQQVLKAEICRLARHENAAGQKALREQIILLKKRLSELEKRVVFLEKLAPKPEPAAEPVQGEKPEADKKSYRVNQARIVAFRKKLNLNQKDFAELLNVSALTVSHWESGQSAPREMHKANIAALKKLGKKELTKRLNEIKKAVPPADQN